MIKIIDFLQKKTKNRDKYLLFKVEIQIALT